MARTPYILAHDLGTTGSKISLFSAGSGVPAASVVHAYPTRYPHPNWAEQDPADWAAALFEGTRAVLEKSGVAPSSIAVVSFSGHMQGLLPLDADGEPLRPAMIWADQRAQEQAKRIEEAVGRARVYEITGERVSPAYTAAKLLWVRDHLPELYARIRSVLHCKDYVAYLLTGRIGTDFSDASGTQMYDIVRRKWSAEILDALGLDAGILPEPLPSSTVIGGVTPQAARRSGLVAGTPVVIGGGDGACATVGAGSVREGQAYTYIGSSGWAALTLRQPLLDREQRTFNMAHLDPELVFALGAIQAAGGAFEWMAGLLHGDTEARFGLMDCEAADVPAGSRGLLFLPHLLGERSPYWNPAARGALVGLSLAHGRHEVTRATMEGVALLLRQIVDIFRAQGAAIAQMRMIGGGARSVLWRQIMADVYDMPIDCPALSTEATALGAAIAGGVGVGLYPDYEVALQLAPTVAEVPVDDRRAAEYEALLPLFTESYRALSPVFEKLVERQRVRDANSPTD